MNDILLTCSDLTCGYDTPLLGPLELTIDDGEFVLIEGPNGIGKSTLLKTVAGLLDPLSGEYRWNVDRRHLRFVPQVRTLDPILPATVADVVATGSQQGSGLAGMRVTASADDIETALEQVDMVTHQNDLFRELSEGQKQLVLLARATIGEPRVLLLDEPAASMDPDRESRAIELLEQKQQTEGRTIFIVAHGSRAASEAATMRLAIDRDRNVTLEAPNR